MRIMIDTNIIISAWLKPDGLIAGLLKRLAIELKFASALFRLKSYSV